MSEPVDQPVKPGEAEMPAEADAQVPQPEHEQTQPPPRYFCHRCTVAFDDPGQGFICPFCHSGFIELIEVGNNAASVAALHQPESNLRTLLDGEEPTVPPPPPSAQNRTRRGPMLNDLAILMSGGVLRNARPDSLVEQLLVQLGDTISGAVGGANAAPAAPAAPQEGAQGANQGNATPGRPIRVETAGTPFLLVGAPGEYVIGGDSLDAVVAQLLGQLENFGPPPMPINLIDSIPIEEVSDEQEAANITCSICWELFKKAEKIARLTCDHFFHKSCIEPWLKLHATCPICRHRLIPDPPPAASNPPAATASPPDPSAPEASATGANTNAEPPPMPTNGHPILRGLLRRVSMGPTGFSATWEESPHEPFLNSGLVFANITATINPTANNENRPPPTQGYNMDIDYD